MYSKHWNLDEPRRLKKRTWVKAVKSWIEEYEAQLTDLEED